MRSRGEDPEFAAEARLTFARPAYEIPAGHPLPDTLGAPLSVARPAGREGRDELLDRRGGARRRPEFRPCCSDRAAPACTDREEYVIVADVMACRDVLALLAGATA